MKRTKAYEAIVILRHVAHYIVDDPQALDIIIDAQYQCYMRPGFNLRRFNEWEHEQRHLQDAVGHQYLALRTTKSGN